MRKHRRHDRRADGHHARRHRPRTEHRNRPSVPRGLREPPHQGARIQNIYPGHRPLHRHHLVRRHPRLPAHLLVSAPEGRGRALPRAQAPHPPLDGRQRPGATACAASPTPTCPSAAGRPSPARCARSTAARASTTRWPSWIRGHGCTATSTPSTGWRATSTVRSHPPRATSPSSTSNPATTASAWRCRCARRPTASTPACTRRRCRTSSANTSAG